MADDLWIEPVVSSSTGVFCFARLLIFRTVNALNTGIAPAAVELGKEALPTFEPLGSGCRIRKGEQRHDDCYHAFIARARAQP
jgi:hypothetical protein